MTNQDLPQESLIQWAERQRPPSSLSTSTHSIAPTLGGQQRLSRHPLSQAFGNRPAPAREELAQILDQSGQVTQVITLDGQVLLDWEVYNAALDLGLPVPMTEFQGKDPLAFVIANCLRHPQWDKGQRAVIAVRLYDWRERGRPRKSVQNTDLTISGVRIGSRSRLRRQQRADCRCRSSQRGVRDQSPAH